MKLVQNFLILLLLISLGIFSVVSARDLSNQNKEPLFERSALSVSDTIPTHLINWPLYHGLHRTGQIDATFSCFGSFGIGFSHPFSGFPTPTYPLGFVTPPDTGSEYLWAGAIWIGGIVDGDTLVSVGGDGWQAIYEFFPPNFRSPKKRGTVNPVDYIADQNYRAEFADTVELPQNTFDPFDFYHRPLNIKVASRNFSWHSSPENKTIIYDLVITNVGNKTINDGYAGFYFDCDVGNLPLSSWTDDLTGSLKEHGIGYIIDDDGDFAFELADRAFAFKFLSSSFEASDTNYNWWLSNGNPDYDFGPRQRGNTENPFRDFGTGGIGTPEGDANKYYIMSFDEWDYDQIRTATMGDTSPVWIPPNEETASDFSDGFDTRFMMSIGPFDLKPDSSARVLFTTFTGEFVHPGPGAINYLPDLPDIYLSLLYFDDLIATAAVAEILADSLLDPHLPPLGLQLVYDSSDEAELQWDPWAYPDVNGYYLYIAETPLETLPYPGAVPPWWSPPSGTLPNIIERTYRSSLDTLDRQKHYLAQIAHKIFSEAGERSKPIQFKINPRPNPLQLVSRYAFANPGGPLKIKWKTPDTDIVDHINIYKFTDSAEAVQGYHAFYDRGYQAQFIQPVDSFFVNDKTYYFYAMEPYAVLSGNDSSFFDSNVTEGEAYLIVAADEYGFESEFSKVIISNVVAEKTKDILLITNSLALTPHRYTYLDSILSFYHDILQGFDYDTYDYRDSTNITNCPNRSINCMDWHDFMSYRLVIVDDRLTESLFSNKYQDTTGGFERYIAYGGKLAYFGRFSGFGWGLSYQNGTPGYVDIGHSFVKDFLGIDSIFFGGEKYYRTNSSEPYIDSLFGFTLARQTGVGLPSAFLDRGRDPFTPRLRNFWTMPTPPGVATFVSNDRAEITHLFRSEYAGTSVQEGKVVGVRTHLPGLNASTYTFGFHLWYMDKVNARELIDGILSSSPFSLAAKTTINKEKFHVFESFSIEPSFATVYVGNIEQGIDVNAVSESSIKLNSSTEPNSISILSSHPAFDGQVLSIEVPLREFFREYSPVWDTVTVVYSVSAELQDERAIRALGSFTLIGRLRRDINHDGQVNIADLTLLVDYLFRNSELPEPTEQSDFNNDGAVNIIDLTSLVDSIFRGIPL